MTEPQVTSADIRAYREELGDQLALYRRAGRLSQQELARRAVCSRSTVANVETGRQAGSLDFWRAVDRELDADGLLLKASVQVTELIRAYALQGAHQRAAASANTRYAGQDCCLCAVVVAQWTGREARALREALRLGFLEFAHAVKVSTNTVVAWERLPAPQLGLAVQQALDRLLAWAGADARARFRLLRHPGRCQRRPPVGPVEGVAVECNASLARVDQVGAAWGVTRG